MKRENLLNESQNSHNSADKLFENRIADDDVVLNVKQAAEFLGISDKKVYELSKDEALPNKKLGRKIKFLRSELIRFMKGEI